MSIPGPWPAGFTVEQDKIVRYLLDLDSRDGGPKAKFFLGFSFAPAQPDVMRAALLDHAALERFTGLVVAPRGLKFWFAGPLHAPDGRSPNVFSVWQMDAAGDGMARLVTARKL